MTFPQRRLWDSVMFQEMTYIWRFYLHMGVVKVPSCNHSLYIHTLSVSGADNPSSRSRPSRFSLWKREYSDSI